MFILDTDTLTLLLRGDVRVTQRRTQADDEVAISVVTLIEVLQGRFASVLKAEDGEKLLRAQHRLAETQRDLTHFVVVPIEAETAAEFDRLRTNKPLKKIGRPDLFIACIALANRATLVTRNLKDFRHVPGLMVENWAD